MPIGTKIKLVKSGDYSLPPVGSVGTIEGRDQDGDPIVRWDGIKGISPIFPGNVIEELTLI
jgi:hypothetical protein